MKQKLRDIDKNIGYGHVIPTTFNVDSEVTKFSAQYTGSPLSYQLLPIERDFVVISNLTKTAPIPTSIIDFCKLPLKFLGYECDWETNDV